MHSSLMATVSHVTVLKIFLLLYLATRGLASIEYGRNITSMFLTCDPNDSIRLNTAKNSGSYVLQLTSSAGSTWCINEQVVECDHQPCRHSIYLQIDNTACTEISELDANSTSNCTAICTETGSGDTVLRTVLIALVAVLIVVLGIVIMCWIGTYGTMKKKIRALQSTVARAAMPTTANSLMTDTNSEGPPTQQPLCFQNASYEHKSPSFSQSPAPECPDTSNIYDLPFQTSAGVGKDMPKTQDTLPKGSIRYKAQEATPKGSLRYNANKPRSVLPRESENICQAAAPESPRVKEIEFSCSINEQQWVAVNEYEVPITQQETQN